MPDAIESTQSVVQKPMRTIKCFFQYISISVYIVRSHARIQRGDRGSVFANLNRERKRERERLVYAHPFGKIRVHRQGEREMCVLFEFRQFLTPRTRLRISKFHVKT